MTSNYRIVVGVDGSAGGRRALRWAVQEASERGGAVQAVYAWNWDGVEISPAVGASPDQERERAVNTLHREIDEIPQRHREGVPIAAEAVEGGAADVLASAATGANLLVLGSHGHSRVWHTVLGSVSESCIRKAPCPVVVIPVPQDTSQPAPANAPAVRG